MITLIIKFFKNKKNYLFLLFFFNLNIFFSMEEKFNLDDFLKNNTRLISSSDSEKLEEEKIKIEDEKEEKEELNKILKNENYNFKEISDEDYKLLIKDNNWKKLEYEKLLKFRDFAYIKENNQNTDLIKKIEIEIKNKYDQQKDIIVNEIQKEFENNLNTFNLVNLSSEDIKNKIINSLNKNKIDEINNEVNDEIDKIFNTPDYKKLNKDDLDEIEQKLNEKSIIEFKSKIQEQREFLIKNEKNVVYMNPDEKEKIKKFYDENLKTKIENVLGTSIKGLKEIADSNLIEHNIKQLKKESLKYKNEMTNLEEELLKLETSEKEIIQKLIKEAKENEEKAKNEKDEAY